MSEIKALDKLREYVDKQREEYNNHNVSFVWQLDTIADEIEAEIADNYMRLPCDIEGVPIHLGDIVEGELLYCNTTGKGTVTTYHIYDNDEPDTVYIKVDCGNGTWTIKELRIERCRHVKSRTLEELVIEAMEFSLHGCDEDELIGKSREVCERIRELFGGDAE